jgi:hypothetical protein
MKEKKIGDISFLNWQSNCLGICDFLIMVFPCCLHFVIGNQFLYLRHAHDDMDRVPYNDINNCWHVDLRMIHVDMDWVPFNDIHRCWHFDLSAIHVDMDKCHVNDIVKC